MDAIKQEVLNSDLLIFGSPVHIGYVTALMMTFLEKVCWTFAKPEKNILAIKGCPVPRSDKRRKALIIVAAGIVSPLYKRACNWSTEQIKGAVPHGMERPSESCTPMILSTEESSTISMRHLCSARSLHRGACLEASAIMQYIFRVRVSIRLKRNVWSRVFIRRNIDELA